MIGRLKRWFGLTEPTPPPNLPSETPAVPNTGENIVIVSDLHLGEACKEHSRIEYLKRGSEIDDEFCRFIDWLTRERIDGRPWCLILGGDLVDFLQVTIVPRDADAERQRYGLGTTEEESAWKLTRMMERHHSAFVYLAAFVGAGNRLEIVQGNHDQELFWPRVRQAFVQGLMRIYFGDEAHAELSPEDFAARIHFNPWFYFQKGLIYMEHGHRFDEFCATPPQLAPLRPRAEQELCQPISGLAIRYFANLERGFRTHDKEHWGLVEYFNYFRSQGVGHILRTAARYVRLLGRMRRYYNEHGRYTSDTAVDAHEARRAEISKLTGMPEDDLDALEGMNVPSVTTLGFDFFIAAGMGEWIAITFWLLSIGVALTVPWPWWAGLLLVVAVAAAGYLGVRAARARIPNDTPRKLDEAGFALGRIVDAPVVVMGHTHLPLRRRMPHDHRAFYVNSGCFLVPEEPIHKTSEPCRCTCTFVVVPHPETEHDRPVPELRRWCCVRHEPAPFRPVES